jgi:hypothetical protein
VVGHGADVTVRTPGRDDQAVRHGTLVFQVDENDVLRLLIVKALQDKGLQAGDAALVLF